jgi:hypothetical protein
LLQKILPNKARTQILENLTLLKNNKASECLDRLDNQPIKFYKLNLSETLQKKDKPILKTLPGEKTTLCFDRLNNPLKATDLTHQNQS